MLGLRSKQHLGPCPYYQKPWNCFPCLARSRQSWALWYVQLYLSKKPWPLPFGIPCEDLSSGERVKEQVLNLGIFWKLQALEDEGGYIRSFDKGPLVMFLWHWCLGNGVDDDHLEIHMLNYLLKLQSHLGTIIRRKAMSSSAKKLLIMPLKRNLKALGPFAEPLSPRIKSDYSI